MSSATTLNEYNGPAVDSKATVLSVLAGVAFILCVPPLLLHAKARHLPTTVLIFSVTYLNLQNTINPIIWPNDNFRTWYDGAILCDMQTKLQIIMSVTIPVSATCICRSLALIFSTGNTPASTIPSAPRTGFLLEIGLCIIFPLCVAAAHIVVQPYRYYVYGIVGCQYSLARNWMTILVVLLWPLFASLIGIVYGVLTIIRLIKHQKQVSTLLANAQISNARFIRVFVLVMLIIIYAFFCTVTLISRIPIQIGVPWRWQNIHPPDWSNRVVFHGSDHVYWFDRWLQLVTGYLIFAVFGLGRESMEMYRRWSRAVRLDRLLKWIKSGSTGNTKRKTLKYPPPAPGVSELDSGHDFGVNDLRLGGDNLIVDSRKKGASIRFELVELQEQSL